MQPRRTRPWRGSLRAALALVAAAVCGACDRRDAPPAPRPPAATVAGPPAPTFPHDPLRPESHFYRLAEHRFRLARFLDDTAGPGVWGHDMDLEHGELRFVDRELRVLLRTRVRLLGTFNGRDRTWMWGWAVDVAQQHPGLAAGFDALRALARGRGRAEFDSRTPVALAGEDGDKVLALTTAGALGMWSYYALPSQGVMVFLGIEACPEVDARPFDAPARITMLRTTSGATPMDWRLALQEYLGAPVRAQPDGSAAVFTLDPVSTLDVRFDARGRVGEMTATLTSRDAGARQAR